MPPPTHPSVRSRIRARSPLPPACCPHSPRAGREPPAGAEPPLRPPFSSCYPFFNRFVPARRPSRPAFGVVGWKPLSSSPLTPRLRPSF